MTNENLKKQMVIKLGTTTNDEAQIISNMVDSANAGALPEVSATDNGQVLTVAEGAWSKAQPQVGRESLYLYYDYDNASTSNINPLFADSSLTEEYTTASALREAVQGKNVILRGILGDLADAVFESYPYEYIYFEGDGTVRVVFIANEYEIGNGILFGVEESGEQ